MEVETSPFQVIYQTAEDGLGDTVKPRLIEAAADLDRVLVIDEAKRELTLSDERIEKAAADAGISARTVRAAKKNLDGRITSKRIGAAWYHLSLIHISGRFRA